MKKLFVIYPLILFLITLSSCNKNINIGALALGQTKEEVKANLKGLNINFEEENPESIRIAGGIYLLNRIWDGAYCKFINDRLESVVMKAPFESLSQMEIEGLKDKLRDLCGYGFNSHKQGDLSVGFGTDSNNNGCLGGIIINDNDDLCVIVRLPNENF